MDNIGQNQTINQQEQTGAVNSNVGASVVVPPADRGGNKFFYFLLVIVIIIFLAVTVLITRQLKTGKFSSGRVAPTSVPSPTMEPLPTPTIELTPTPTTEATDSAVLKLRAMGESDEILEIEEDINNSNVAILEESLVILDKAFEYND